MIKKVIQQGRSDFDARSVLPVREHDKIATCLRVAASAKAGNAAGGFFQHSHLVNVLTVGNIYAREISWNAVQNFSGERLRIFAYCETVSGLAKSSGCNLAI